MKRGTKNMLENRRYVSVSIKANVYDRLFQLSRKVLPGTQLSISKVIEIITTNQERIAAKNDDDKK